MAGGALGADLLLGLQANGADLHQGRVVLDGLAQDVVGGLLWGAAVDGPGGDHGWHVALVVSIGKGLGLGG
ncbi:hypothetical protein D3C84_1232600 [compost metagenome]